MMVALLHMESNSRTIVVHVDAMMGKSHVNLFVALQFHVPTLLGLAAVYLVLVIVSELNVLVSYQRQLYFKTGIALGCRVNETDYASGHEVSDFSSGRCETCRCIAGEVTCSREECLSMTCRHARTDGCCPSCDGQIPFILLGLYTPLYYYFNTCY